jgi:glucose dehydrogenase
MGGTAGGLVFIAAAQDHVLRAFDIGNGREVWSANLPAVGASMPVSYVSASTGRQYIVIARRRTFCDPRARCKRDSCLCLTGPVKVA